MISSASNPKLRYVRSLSRAAARAREGRFVVEGMRLVDDALDAGIRPAFAMTSTTWGTTERAAALRARLEEHHVPVFDVSPAAFAELADTETPQGVLAVVRSPDLPLPAQPDLLLVIDGMRDPGNLGTLLRTAAAAAVDGVLLVPGTVDPTNPKVVRAAMGAHFRVPILERDWAAVAAVAGDGASGGLGVWLADTTGAHDYAQVDWRGPSALVVAGEAHGPSDAARKLAGGTVRIPMPGTVESLNAATAAAVILFEAIRQRRGDAGARYENRSSAQGSPCM